MRSKYQNSSFDLKQQFADISRVVTMMNTSGSVELQMGHYIDETGIAQLVAELENYSFLETSKR
jgi:hypothetical protein